VEAEEDIKCETRGILQDLLLALAKVRTGLKGREFHSSGWGMGESREDCCSVIDKRRLQGHQGLACWSEDKKKLSLKESPPEHSFSF
jgi:hypothetical protein